MPDDTTIMPSEFLESIQRLTRDLKSASITLSEREARFLVDAYYAMQRDRIRAGHQNRTLSENAEPHDVLLWLQAQRDTLEKQIARALDAYSGGLVIGQWARSQVGIGPIIAAGLAANIDIAQAPTVGHIWRFAGLDPTSHWHGTAKAAALVNEVVARHPKSRHISEAALLDIANAAGLRIDRVIQRLDGKPATVASVAAIVAKRPWNNSLKRLCFLIGESFVKVSGNPDAVYGQAYLVRKQQEVSKNEAGDFADQAAKALVEKKWRDDTEAKKHYEAGRLPPARIHMRAKRWAVKLFIAHYHHVLYESTHGVPPPKPYIMERDPRHTRFIAPPDWPM